MKLPKLKFSPKLLGRLFHLLATVVAAIGDDGEIDHREAEDIWVELTKLGRKAKKNSR